MNQYLVIYFNAEKTARQVVRPGKAFFDEYFDELKPERMFSGWRGLVEGITRSNHRLGIKNYHSYEIK